MLATRERDGTTAAGGQLPQTMAGPDIQRNHQLKLMVMLLKSKESPAPASQLYPTPEELKGRDYDTAFRQVFDEHRFSKGGINAVEDRFRTIASQMATFANYADLTKRMPAAEVEKLKSRAFEIMQRKGQTPLRPIYEKAMVEAANEPKAREYQTAVTALMEGFKAAELREWYGEKLAYEFLFRPRRLSMPEYYGEVRHAGGEEKMLRKMMARARELGVKDPEDLMIRAAEKGLAFSTEKPWLASLRRFAHEKLKPYWMENAGGGQPHDEGFSRDSGVMEGVTPAEMMEPDGRAWKAHAGQSVRHEIGALFCDHGHLIDGGRSTARKDSREIIVVDWKRDTHLQQLYGQILRDAGMAGGHKPTGEERRELLDRVFNAIKKSIRYDPNAFEDKEGREILIGESVDKKTGVCRHMGIATAAIIEHMIEDGKLGGRAFYVRGIRHGWALYEPRKGAINVFDAAQKGEVVDIDAPEAAYFTGGGAQRYRDAEQMRMIYAFVGSAGSRRGDDANTSDLTIEPRRRQP